MYRHVRLPSRYSRSHVSRAVGGFDELINIYPEQCQFHYYAGCMANVQKECQRDRAYDRGQGDCADTRRYQYSLASGNGKGPGRTVLGLYAIHSELPHSSMVHLIHSRNLLETDNGSGKI